MPNVRVLCAGIDEVRTMLEERGELGTIHERIRYFNDVCFGPLAKTFVFFLALSEEGTILGAGMLGPGDRKPGSLAVHFNSVDPQYRHQGIGTVLQEAMTLYCKEHGCPLSMSSYTKLGAKYLKRMSRRLASLHGVEFWDPDMQYTEQLRRRLGREPTEEEVDESVIRHGE